jgi:hypothetical protein
MESLARLWKHLPGSRLPPEAEDPLLPVVLKEHLLIEAELIDICGRLLKNPSALEKANLRFSTRLNLICALLEPDELPASVVMALQDLNTLRNSLAHNLEPTDFHGKLQQFFRRFDEFEALRSPQGEERTIARQFTDCVFFLCGVLGRVGRADTET